MRLEQINPILLSDSYKVGHWAVLPEGTEYLYSYLESRGGLYQETVFFGLQYYLKKYLTVQITHEMINSAEVFFTKHFGTKAIFNRVGWEHIVNAHDGYLPLRIKAVPEGMVIPTRNVMMTIENTDAYCPWLTNYVETLLLKVWYTITVATLSREIKKTILEYLVKTGDPAGLAFKLHDFGYRGASSEESAMLGGMAHLVNFMGTDTMIALVGAFEYYGEEMAGFSIPATEHSVMSALGELGELRQMERFLKAFGDGPYPAIACVSDTYDIYRACSEYWGQQLFREVTSLNNGKVLVVRPDSGDPVTVVRQVVEMLADKFGYTTNEKGYKVLNHVRVIQGDGITHSTIKAILEELTHRKWSADNVAFGMGGALLQQVNRDTQKFAIKASSIVINGSVRDVWKSPVTDNGKRSKAGRLKLMYNNDGVLETYSSNVPGQDMLEWVFENGKVLVNHDFKDIRTRANLTVPVEEGAWS
jgi:nicotinamide phosphoribosyltransferase